MAAVSAEDPGLTDERRVELLLEGIARSHHVTPADRDWLRRVFLHALPLARAGQLNEDELRRVLLEEL